MGVSERLGVELKTFRKAKKLTQLQVAQLLNKSPACISKYEKGEIVMDIETFLEYGRILQIDPTHLINQLHEPGETGGRGGYGVFYQKAPLYLYWYDGKRKKVFRGALELDLPSEKSKFYLYINDPQNYRQCKYFYTGHSEAFTPFTRFTFYNVNDPCDLTMLTVYNQGDDDTYRIALMYIMSYYYQPMATKCLISSKPVYDEELLLNNIKLSKDELRYIKSTNFLLCQNTNISPE